MGLLLRELPRVDIDKIDKSKWERQERKQNDAFKAVKIIINKNKQSLKKNKEF
jgi:hypothetical protein